MHEILLSFLFYSPNIVKTEIAHLVFVAMHEQEISEPFQRRFPTLITYQLNY